MLVAGALVVAAVVVLVVGVARNSTSRTPERATVVLAVDTSSSMEATDVAPTRLGAAQGAATAFVDRVPPTVRIGLVQFDVHAVAKVAPTTDHDRLKSAISDLTTGPSTAIGEGVYASLDAIAAVPLDGEPTAPARIILVSDGKTQIGRSDESASEAARAAGVPVWAIALGTGQGTIVGGERTGGSVPAPVDRDALRAMAKTTGGSFFEVSTAGELRRVYEELGSSLISPAVADPVLPRGFLVVGLVLLAAAGAAGLVALGSRRRNRA
jgi:Ca-activated chloride channel family protein